MTDNLKPFTIPELKIFIKRNIGAVISSSIVLLLLIIYMGRTGSFLTSFQARVLVNGGMALTFAAIGVCAVVISGGFDVSVGAIICLINVLAATQLNDNIPHDILIIIILIGIGALAGLINGVLVAIGRLQSIIVTLAMMFVWNGISLLILKKPGGFIPLWLTNGLEGSIQKVFPVSIIWLILGFFALMILRNTKFSTSMYAIGSDEHSAFRSGISVVRTKIAVFTFAGFCYAWAGLFLSAQTTSGDPNIGAPFLLTAFTAVVVGGTPFGGGRGSLIGAIFGAFIITLLDSVLLSLGVTSYYTDIVQGSLLVITVAANTVIPWMMEFVNKNFRQ